MFNDYQQILHGKAGQERLQAGTSSLSLLFSGDNLQFALHGLFRWFFLVMTDKPVPEQNPGLFSRNSSPGM